MHLTQFSDYSLRLLIYLGCRADRLVSVDEVSRAFGISRHHLVKVASNLADLGLIDSQRGRNGGMRLALDPADINVGRLVARTESHWNLVECFDPSTNTCPIAPACVLKSVLHRAQAAFLDVLNKVNLADLLGPRPALVTLFDGVANHGDFLDE